MTRIVTFVAAMVLALAMAVPAFAADAGADFGAHHATHARDMGGFSATMNPGMHTGFAGWTGM